MTAAGSEPVSNSSEMNSFRMQLARLLETPQQSLPVKIAARDRDKGRAILMIEFKRASPAEPCRDHLRVQKRPAILAVSVASVPRFQINVRHLPGC